MEPRLLKFDPGLALAPIPRKPLAVVPAKVELLKVKPPDAADDPGAQAAPKQPLVKPAINTWSACALVCPAASRASAARPRTSCLVVNRISDFIWISLFP